MSPAMLDGEQRLEQARRRVTLAVALLGCLICTPAGGSILVVGVAAAVGILAGRRFGRPTVRAAGWWRVLNTSALVICLLAFFARVPLMVVGTGLVAWLQVHRAWTGRTARDDRVALLLALLQALLGCILSVSLALAPMFLGLAILAPVALALCHLGMESDSARGNRLRAGGVAGPPRLLWGLGPATALLTAALFVVLPRLQGGPRLTLDEPSRVTGFGDDVDLGDLGPMLENDAIVMRVKATDPQGRAYGGPLYLRGAALDAFDGERWTSTAGRGGRWRPPPPGQAPRIEQQILLEPLTENALFGLQEVVDLRGVGRRVYRDTNGVLRVDGDPARLEYTAWSELRTATDAQLASVRPDPRVAARSRGEIAAADVGLWTQLPPDLDPRIPALARQMVAPLGPDASAWEQGVASAAALQRDYRYTLTPPPTPDGGPPDDPLAWFLFESRQGHCEYFATALAVLLRTRGVPTRVVNGFLDGELNPLGGWVLVRQRDAHSWVEVNMGPHGWVTMDATPAGDEGVLVSAPWTQAADWLGRRWHGAFLQYELGDQLAGLAWLGRAVSLPGNTGVGGLPMPAVGGLFAAGVIGVLIAVGVRGLLRWAAREPARRSRGGKVDRVHDRAWRWVRARGWSPPPALPPVAAAEWVVAEAGPAAAPLQELAWLRYRVRYGGEADDDCADAARQAFDRLKGSGLSRALPEPDLLDEDGALVLDDNGAAGSSTSD